jgi:hypothetical protein
MRRKPLPSRLAMYKDLSCAKAICPPSDDQAASLATMLPIGRGEPAGRGSA